MIDYDAIYVEILHYLSDNFGVTMGDAALHSEQITEMIKERVEEDIINGEEQGL